MCAGDSHWTQLTAERVLYPDRVKPDQQRKIVGQLIASFIA